jgi:hypothetical protein
MAVPPVVDTFSGVEEEEELEEVPRWTQRYSQHVRK